MRRPNWRAGAVLVEGTKRGDELRREDREMARPQSGLFDDQGPAWESRVGSDGVSRREDGTTEELIPDGQGETEVHVLGPVQLVVNTVKVRADKESFQWAEAQVGVGMGERDDGSIDDEKRGRQPAVGE